MTAWSFAAKVYAVVVVAVLGAAVLGALADALERRHNNHR